MQVLAQFDCLVSLAKLAEQEHYTLPQLGMAESGERGSGHWDEKENEPLLCSCSIFFDFRQLLIVDADGEASIAISKGRHPVVSAAMSDQVRSS